MKALSAEPIRSETKWSQAAQTMLRAYKRSNLKPKPWLKIIVKDLPPAVLEQIWKAEFVRKRGLRGGQGQDDGWRDMGMSQSPESAVRYWMGVLIEDVRRVSNRGNDLTKHFMWPICRSCACVCLYLCVWVSLCVSVYVCVCVRVRVCLWFLGVGVCVKVLKRCIYIYIYICVYKTSYIYVYVKTSIRFQNVVAGPRAYHQRRHSGFPGATWPDQKMRTCLQDCFSDMGRGQPKNMSH